MLRICFVALGLLVSASAFAGIGQPVAKIDAWDVHLTSDSMTDKKICTAVYNGNAGIQYTLKDFAIGSLIWPTTYRYRLDDKKASPTISTSNAERKVGAVVIMDPKILKELLSSKRLRLQILANGQYDYDIDISGLPKVYAFLKSSKCN